MLAQKERAAGAAPGQQVQAQVYKQSEAVSNQSLREQIGELLFSLEFPVSREVSELGWRLFERLLRRYISLRIAQSAHQGADMAAGAEEDVAGGG